MKVLGCQTEIRHGLRQSNHKRTNAEGNPVWPISNIGRPGYKNGDRSPRRDNVGLSPYRKRLFLYQPTVAILSIMMIWCIRIASGMAYGPAQKYIQTYRQGGQFAEYQGPKKLVIALKLALLVYPVTATFEVSPQGVENDVFVQPSRKLKVVLVGADSQIFVPETPPAFPKILSNLRRPMR